MKTSLLFAVFALVQATWAATNEKDELHRKHAEMAEATKRVSRHLREGPGGHALKEGAKNIRRIKGDEMRLDEKRTEKHAAHAEKIRKVAEGVKQQQRRHADPAMRHQIDAAKLAKHSMAADGNASARKREKAAVNAESMKRMANQIPTHKLHKPDESAADKFKKTIPGVKKAANGFKETAAKERKVAPGSMKRAQDKLEKMSKNVNTAEDENGEQ